MVRHHFPVRRIAVVGMTLAVTVVPGCSTSSHAPADCTAAPPPVRGQFHLGPSDGVDGVLRAYVKQGVTPDRVNDLSDRLSLPLLGCGIAFSQANNQAGWIDFYVGKGTSA